MARVTGADLLMRTARKAKAEELGGLPADAYDMAIAMLFDIFGGNQASLPAGVEALTELLDEVEQAVLGVVVMTLSAAHSMGASQQTFEEAARIGVQIALRLPAYRATRSGGPDL